MHSSCDVCAIGGGPDALAAATFLALSGHSVLVVGERGQPGGIAANAQIAPGFCFPVAPETMPSFDPEVAGRLALDRYGLEFLDTDPVLTVVGHGGGEPFALPRRPEAACRAIAGISTRDAARFPEFAGELGALAGFLRRLLEQPPLSLDSSFENTLPAALAAWGLGGRGLTRLLRVLPMAVRDLLDDWFESGPLKAALAGPALTGTRLGPRAPGTAGLFLHFHAFGQPAPLHWILPPRGGATAVGKALREAARAAGTQFESESGGVRRILLGPGGKAAGIELADGRTVRCGTVLSDASPKTTLLRWTGAAQLPPEFVHEARNIRYRGAAARVGLALSRLPRFLDAEEKVPESDPRLGGVIQIGGEMDSLERAADAAKYREIAERPTVFAFFPSVHAAGLAPEGGAVLAATVQSVPYGRENSETEVLERTIRALGSAFPEIAELVSAARVLPPGTLESGFGLTEGSFHQGEPTLDQLYSLRPVPGFARHRTPISGLYLAGPGTYPYGGLHGVSGRNAARAIIEDLSR